MAARAVIFDVDGVLVDSYEAHFQSWSHVAREDGIAFTLEDFRASFGKTSRDIIRSIWSVRGAMTAEAEREIDDRKESAYRAIVSKDFPAMPGAVALIDLLRARDFLLAVGSSGPAENIELALTRLGRADSFLARVTGQDVSRGKPDPEVFLLAARRLKVKPDQCVVIEDAPHGIEAAHRAGMTAIGLARDAEVERSLLAQHPFRVVRTLQELDSGAISALTKELSRTGPQHRKLTPTHRSNR